MAQSFLTSWILSVDFLTSTWSFLLNMVPAARHVAHSRNGPHGCCQTTPSLDPQTSASTLAAFKCPDYPAHLDSSRSRGGHFDVRRAHSVTRGAMTSFSFFTPLTHLFNLFPSCFTQTNHCQNDHQHFVRISAHIFILLIFLAIHQFDSSLNLPRNREGGFLYYRLSVCCLHLTFRGLNVRARVLTILETVWGLKTERGTQTGLENLKIKKDKE